MADTFTRVSAGRWKNNRTGVVTTSATDPGKATVGNKVATNVVKNIAPKPVTNKALGSNITGANNTATNVANNLLGGVPSTPYNYQDAGAIPTANDGYRQQIQDATYQNLTQGNADNKARDLAAQGQSLADRGIPVGSDLYNDQMKQLNTRYDTLDQQAHSQAVQQGESAVQGQYGRDEGAYQDRLGGIQSNYTFPTQIAGNLLSGANTAYGTGASADLAQQQFEQDKKQFGLTYALQKQAAARAGRSSGTAKTPAATYPDYSGQVAGLG